MTPVPLVSGPPPTWTPSPWQPLTRFRLLVLGWGEGGGGVNVEGGRPSSGKGNVVGANFSVQLFLGAALCMENCRRFSLNCWSLWWSPTFIESRGLEIFFNKYFHLFGKIILPIITIHNQLGNQPVKQYFSVLTTLSLPGEVVVAVVEAAGTWCTGVWGWGSGLVGLEEVSVPPLPAPTNPPLRPCNLSCALISGRTILRLPL